MSSKSFTLNNYKSIKPFKKIIEVDSDKSLSIRSFLIGAISQGISKTYNVLESEDVYSTINCLKKLRVKIEKIKPKSYLVYGKGLGSLIAKKNSQLDFGNSGTLARLLISILSKKRILLTFIRSERFILLPEDSLMPLQLIKESEINL